MGRKILGIVVTLGIMLVGANAYSTGGAMELRFIGIEISPALFYTVMGVILIFEVVDLFSSQRKPSTANSAVADTGQPEQPASSAPADPEQGPTP